MHVPTPSDLRKMRSRPLGASVKEFLGRVYAALARQWPQNAEVRVRTFGVTAEAIRPAVAALQDAGWACRLDAGQEALFLTEAVAQHKEQAA